MILGLVWGVRVGWRTDSMEAGDEAWSDVDVLAPTPTEATLIAAQLVMSAHLADVHGHVTSTRIVREAIA